MPDSDSKGLTQAFVTGQWTVIPSRNLLARGNEEIHVEPRVMDTLVYLSERPGLVVSKDELAEDVWQNRPVTDDVLTVTISALRKALGDDARRPEYIETVPRRGYRWVAPVSRSANNSKILVPNVAQGQKLQPAALPGQVVRRFAALGIAFAVLASVTTWILLHATKHRHVPLPEAHEAYLKGRFFLDQRSIQGWRQALEQFERATNVDPQDSSAQAGLADTYSAMSDFGVASPAELRPRAFRSAERALQLDRNSAEGYEALGRAQFLFDWDFPAAERSLNKALLLNAEYMPAHQAMAWLKSAEGRYAEAVDSARTALQLDPVNTARYTELAWVLALARRYDEAQHEIERALALNPRSFEAYLMKGWISDLAGDPAAAFRAYHDGLRMTGAPDEALRRIENVYRTRGLAGYYRNWLDLQGRGSKLPMSSTFRAQLCVHAGKTDQALEFLEDAYKRHEGALAWVNVEPSFQSLRSEPRFKMIAERIGQGFSTFR